MPLARRASAGKQAARTALPAGELCCRLTTSMLLRSSLWSPDPASDSNSCRVKGCSICSRSPTKCDKCRPFFFMKDTTTCTKVQEGVHGAALRWCYHHPIRSQPFNASFLCCCAMQCQPHCVACTSPASCLHCQAGFGLVSGRCVKCAKALGKECRNCDGNRNRCRRCMPEDELAPDPATGRCVALWA